MATALIAAAVTKPTAAKSPVCCEASPATLMTESAPVAEDNDGSIVLNEVLYDPAPGPDGDANQDGSRDARRDEFIEIYNTSSSEQVDLSGYEYIDESIGVRHEFPEGTVVSPEESIVVFGGGDPSEDIPGVVQTASEGTLGLNNDGDTLTIVDDEGAEVLRFSYDGDIEDQSLTRDPDFTGDFVPHNSASGAGGAPFSPGRTTDGDPLPVEIASFEGTQSGESKVRLRWQTASETNNAGFRVKQRRKKESSWSEIGYVESKAEDGTSTEALSYSFTAEGLEIGTHQFRLEQVDLDGTTRSHDPVIVKLGMQEARRLSAPAPNPVSGRSMVSFTVKEEVETKITLYNLLGQKVGILYEGTPRAEEEQTIQVDAAELSSGVYVMRLEAGGKIKTRRVTVVR